MREIIPGIYTWSHLSRYGYNFNGYAFMSRDGLVVIDPPIMEEEEMNELEKLGRPAHILLTNKDHERMAYELRDRFKAPIYINEEDSRYLKSSPDHTFRSGDILPGNLKAINIPDNKSPGETALLPQDKPIVFVGDAVIGWPAGEFSLLPAGAYKHPRKAKESIKRLLNYDYDAVLVGDGESVLKNGKEAINRFLIRDNVHLKLPVWIEPVD